MKANITQTAVTGIEHTVTTDTNKLIHRKLASKPLLNSFQSLLSRRGKNRRGSEGRFIQMSLPSNDTEEEEEEEEEEDKIHTETDEKREIRQ